MEIGMRPLCSSTRRVVRTGLLLGGRIFKGSFGSSTYVQLVPLGIRGSAAPLQTELSINRHTMVADKHRNVLIGEEGASGTNHSVGTTVHTLITKY